MDDQYIALIAGDLLVDVEAIVKALIIRPADPHSHESYGIRNILALRVEHEPIVRNAQGWIHKHNGLDLFRDIRSGNGRDAAALALSQQEDTLRVHAVPAPDHVDDIHQILPLRKDRHLFRAAFTAATGRAAGKVIAITHVAQLGQRIDHAIKTLVRGTIAVRHNHSRMLPGRTRYEGLAIQTVPLADTRDFPHFISRVRRRLPLPARPLCGHVQRPKRHRQNQKKMTVITSNTHRNIDSFP